DFCRRTLHPFWQVWRGSDEAEKLWQQVIHPFGQEIQVLDKAESLWQQVIHPFGQYKRGLACN
ncbi:MAG: hypothetical protein PHX95_08550, partial [Lachnospiraceae bacterium]|nr:hypothetical protein [Lachnospiraceae bacterium]